MMTYEELRRLQALPLDVKIEKTKARIFEFAMRFGIDGVYVSYSGGKDSTVLLDIARSVFPNMKAVFCDTGLEFPEVKEAALSTPNLDVIRPKMNFRETVREYGYPVISKEQSKYIWDIRHGSERMRNVRLNGNPKGGFKIADKWRFVLDAPFEISDKCCNIMKKRPFKAYNAKTGRKPIIGTMADESHQRETSYLKTGCNVYEGAYPKSTPMAFWRTTDVLEYVLERNLKLPAVYGDIVWSEGGYKTTGVNRTGCVFCCYGLHLQGHPNKFECLRKTHPKLYEYCMNGGGFVDGVWMPNSKGLGIGKVLEFLGMDEGLKYEQIGFNEI